jgi:uncharacterized protein (TIGR03546 family)
MLLLAYAKKLIGILNDKASPGQIAGAAALGAVIGLLPGFSLLSVLLFLAVCLLNVNLSAALFAVALFKPVGYLLDPLAHRTGLLLLDQIRALTPLWTFLYNLPFVPYTRFNNTVVLGSFVLGLLLAAPIFLAVRRGVVVYRERWRAQIEKWKIVQALKASSFFSLYQKISGLKPS